MTDIADQLRHDRALRNAARAVIDADIAHIKADLTPAVLGSRLSEGASEVFDHASDVAEDNKGVLGALVAALFIWFARNPILSFLDRDDGEEQDDEFDTDAEPQGHSPRSVND